MISKIILGIKNAVGIKEEISGYLKYLNNDRIDDIFGKQRIRYTQPLELNDPLEFNPVLTGYAAGHHSPFNINGFPMPPYDTINRQYLFEQNVNKFGVLSLTKNILSYNMWSRYANGHKGFVIELVHNFYESEAFQAKITVSKGIKKVKYEPLFKIDLNSFVEKNGNISFDKLYDQVFFKKTNHWQDENEYRLTRGLEDLEKDEKNPKVYLGQLPLGLIVTVVFGALMSPEDKKLIINYCKGARINFIQSIVFRDRPQNPMFLFPLDDKETFKMIINWKPRHFIMERNHFKEMFTPITLENIKDLPYYNSNPKFVEDFYKKVKERMCV